MHKYEQTILKISQVSAKAQAVNLPINIFNDKAKIFVKFQEEEGGNRNAVVRNLIDVIIFA